MRWRRRLDRDGLPCGPDDWMFCNTTGRFVIPNRSANCSTASFSARSATHPCLATRRRRHHHRGRHRMPPGTLSASFLGDDTTKCGSSAVARRPTMIDDRQADIGPRPHIQPSVICQSSGSRDTTSMCPSNNRVAANRVGARQIRHQRPAIGQRPEQLQVDTRDVDQCAQPLRSARLVSGVGPCRC